MAQLSSPGVSVTVIDESFYTPAAAGTVPLIVVASAESKQNGAGTGIAQGTTKANAGQVYLLTSQKDLSDTFGTPVFKTDASNNPVHAGEQNEYGLQAAYSFLGVSNRAYVVRADIDLAQLNATATAPAGEPENGQYWFDTASTSFGIFEWNSASATVEGGQTFSVKYPMVITDTNMVTSGQPKASVGSIGSYAIVATTTLNKLWYKKAKTNTAAGTWVEVGSDLWRASWPVAQGTVSGPALLSGDILEINASQVTGVTTLTALVTAINTAAITGVTAADINGKLELYSTGVNVAVSGSSVAKLGLIPNAGTTGTFKAPALQMSAHTSVPTFKRSDDLTSVYGRPTGSIWVKTTSANLGADWIVKKYNAATEAWAEVSAPLYMSNAEALSRLDSTGGGINLALGATYVKYNDDEAGPDQATFKIYARKSTGATAVKSVIIKVGTVSSGAKSFTISESVKASAAMTTPVTVSFTATGTAGDADLLLDSLTAALPINSNIVATKDSNNQVTLTHLQGGEIKFVDGTGTPLASLFSAVTTANFYVDPAANGATNMYVASLWTPSFGIIPGADAPTTITAQGQLWYNSIVDEADILVHNGTTWVGYLDVSAATLNGAGIAGYLGTDKNGPIVSATKPTKQSDGATVLQNGDLWIDTSDVENYPMIYKYNDNSKKWILIDTTDQTSENGILFHDARAGTTGGTTTTPPSGSIVDLLASNFLDPDAPDPALYPRGMLLFNLRRSGFNVKQFNREYVNVLDRNRRQPNDPLMTSYYPHRWVSVAANQENGAGTFGRKAQRKVVQQALQALVNGNQQIRDEESRVFNLLSCPGYPELIDELISLNYDRGLTAFIVGDTPARLKPDATTLSNWGNNIVGAFENNDSGLVSTDAYLGVFYPWGYTSDLLGNNIVVPPSHMMLRTIALSDNVSYPWFAPAGTRRGGITNASAVGYVDPETGEFQSVALNNGQRDTLASIHVNPITYITGTGLVNYGQKTRQLTASSLDRINVARLVVYLRRQFAQLAKPYVFEPNDRITRDEIKNAAESLLLELVGQRAIYDYLVVCDESNNTPARIDRNELYLDVAVEPVKAVEFIYIPLRLKNTGEIKGLG